MDIGIQEILLIAVLSLIVLGPDRLPAVVRTLALWVNRIKRSVGTLKKEIEKEINADDIRQQIHNENVLHELGESTAHLQETARTIEQDLQVEEKMMGNRKPLK